MSHEIVADDISHRKYVCFRALGLQCFFGHLLISRVCRYFENSVAKLVDVDLLPSAIMTLAWIVQKVCAQMGPRDICSSVGKNENEDV